MTVFVGSIYRDDEYDAAVECRDLGYFPTLEAALAAVNAARSEPWWATGGIEKGELVPAVFGVSPELFESDGRGSWFVGTDGLAVR